MNEVEQRSVVLGRCVDSSGRVVAGEHHGTSSLVLLGVHHYVLACSHRRGGARHTLPSSRGYTDDPFGRRYARVGLPYRCGVRAGAVVTAFPAESDTS